MVAFIVLIGIVLIGIVFDVIGVAVTVTGERKAFSLHGGLKGQGSEELPDADTERQQSL